MMTIKMPSTKNLGTHLAALTASCFLLTFLLTGCQPETVTQLAVPPATQGFQLHVPAFDVASGDEVQACYFFAVPGNPTEEVWVNRYEMAQAIGSHHMNVFRVNTIKNLTGVPGGPPVVSKNGMGECFVSSNWSDWPLVTNSQQDSLTDWKLPATVAAKFHGGELLMLQTHFVNASTQKTPKKAEVSVNFWTTPPQPNELGTLFATNQNIRICPGDTNASFTKTCNFTKDAVHVVAANGHFHSRGKLFEMFSTAANGDVGTKFYTSTSWDDPPMMRDFTDDLPAGGGVQWKCTFDFPTGACGDPNNACCYTFGGKVETQEHCNAFVYYWPKAQPADVNCF